MTAPLRLTVRRTAPPRAGLAGALAAPPRVSLRLPTDTDCIEEAVMLVVKHCFAGRPPSAARSKFRLQVALCEALTNAMLRGNREDRSKRVLVEAELGDDTVRVTVTDEGAGFDPHLVPSPCTPETLTALGGRGLHLIRCLVDHVGFNDRGNSICLTLRLA